MRNNMLYDMVATHDAQSPDKDTLLTISQKGEFASGQKTVVYMLIDVSGSMEGTLDQLKKRLAALIPNLPDNVALVVIVFSDKARILCSFESMNDVNRAHVQRQILWLSACGGTNIEDALNVATMEKQRHYMHHKDYLLLLTDGVPTVGKYKMNPFTMKWDHDDDPKNLASKTAAFSTVDLMLFTEMSSAELGEQVRRAGGEVSFVRQADAAVEMFVTKGLQFGQGLRKLTLRVTDGQKEFNFNTTSAELRTEAQFLLQGMTTTLYCAILQNGVEVIWDSAPAVRLLSDAAMTNAQRMEFDMQRRVQKCRNRLIAVNNTMFDWKEAQVAAGVPLKNLQFSDASASQTLAEVAAIEQHLKNIKVTTNGDDAASAAAATTFSCKQEGGCPTTTISPDAPLYRSLAAVSELYDNTRQKVHAMSPAQEEQQVADRPKPKSKPPLPVPNPEKDILRHSDDEPGSKRQDDGIGYRSLCASEPTPVYTRDFEALCAATAQERALIDAENMAADEKWRQENASVLEWNDAIKQAKAVKEHIMCSISQM